MQVFVCLLLLLLSAQTIKTIFTTTIYECQVGLNYDVWLVKKKWI